MFACPHSCLRGFGGPGTGFETFATRCTRSRQGVSVRIEFRSRFTRSIRTSGLGLCDLRVRSRCADAVANERAQEARGTNGVASAGGCGLKGNYVRLDPKPDALDSANRASMFGAG